MESFSILTVSKRKGWERVAAESIARQTVRPKHWVIVTSDLKPTNSTIHTWMDVNKVPDSCRVDGGCLVDCRLEPKKTRLSNLNASLNHGLKVMLASADCPDYVIFYQDFIDLPEDCCEKLLELADERTFVTTCTPNYDGSDDGRYTGCDMARPCLPAEWEANVALAPMQILRDLGGFDEEYDWGWSWDNVNVAERAAMLGGKFICDESNRPTLHPHEMSSHETLPKNGERHARTMAEIREGRRPLKLPYL